MTKRTYFGLEIVGAHGVRLADIKRLPFAKFWEKYASSSSQIRDCLTDEWLVPISEWAKFADHFIATGRHIGGSHLSGRPTEINDQATARRTHFGLLVYSERMVREIDIAALPFADLWRASSIGSTGLVDPETNDHLVFLDDWEAFSEMFIETGRHRYMLDPDSKTEN